MATTRRIVVTLESVLESVDLAEGVTLSISEAIGFDEEDRHKIGMAVREGVINALTYGNQMSPEKKVRLTLALQPDRLQIQVLDEGAGFDLSEVPDPLAEENLLKASGRGILLMRSFMDEFNVTRAPEGGAELSMAKLYPADNSAGPGR
jgi:serine/threonine-protein kinase RsbW